MDITTVTIIRTGTKNNADADAERLGIELNEANHYHGQFDATLLSIDPMSGNGLVVKDDKRLYRVKVGEITNVQFTTV